MISPGTQISGPPLLLIEGGLTVIGIGLAFCFPQLGSIRSTWFSIIERFFARLARKKALAIAAVGLTEFLLRLAMLPWFPIPLPAIPDEFSFLLAADTFSCGRLANPTPAMWTHFETMQVSMQPTYMSIYFPAHGLVLAAGNVLFGHAWFGELCITALMCAAICWMLQAWLPATWALFGGLIAVLRIGLFSYWINTYTGGGSIPALGGALVLGALPRIMRKTKPIDCVLLAAGIVILALSRPYEGLLLCIPVSIALGHWLLFGKNRPKPARLLRLAIAPLIMLVAAGSWLGYYDLRNFGNPLTLPYVTYRATYTVAPTFIWQSPRPEPVYRHKAIRDFYNINELHEFNRVRSNFIPQLFVKAGRAIEFYAGLALLPPLFMLRRVFLDRRVRFLLICVFVLMAGMIAEAVLLSYYLAPFVAALYAIGLQSMRHLRQWKPEGKRVGFALVRMLVLICLAMASLNIWKELCYPGLVMTFAPAVALHGSYQQGLERADMQRQLEGLPGQQLVLVRYSEKHEPMNEWVENAPDIDQSKVIWAREMDAKNDAELIEHYKDRHVWLVQPDIIPASLTPFTPTRNVAASTAASIR